MSTQLSRSPPHPQDGCQPYTYTCQHREGGAPSHFIGKLLDKELIKPHDDRQLLVFCPRCMGALSSDEKRGNIMAALAPAASEGTKDTMTIFVLFANIWAEFRRNPTEEAVELLQLVFEAMGKAYQDDRKAYTRILKIIKASYDPLLQHDIICTVCASKNAYNAELVTETIHKRWRAYDNACYRFWERISEVRAAKTALPIDLTHLVNDILIEGVGYITGVLGPPKDEDAQFEFAHRWWARNRYLCKEDLMPLREIIYETAKMARVLKMQLHRLSWSKTRYVSTSKDFKDVVSRVKAINTMATNVKGLDIKRRERWNRWSGINK
ncbi:hypothetical protein AB5N19_02012 [Seiridium cardinale]